jgi:phosphoglycolate phosphatase-like HAD superfamily hydrolase
VLVLFDIDGTLLLRAFPAHREALHAALRDVYGLADPTAATLDGAGRTDGEIARGILLQTGYSAEHIDDGMEEFRAACCEHFARLCAQDLLEHVAPGMARLLEALEGRDDVRLSLVTGNLEPIARLKLARADLGRHFARGQGAFGSDHEDRTALPGIARMRAGADGQPYPREQTVVVGDTPRDIACARADGVRCLAVATGPFRVDQLTGADAVARDAHELAPLLGV